MKLLLDTHTFLWFIMDIGRVSSRALESMKDPQNDLILSVASAWEIAIKTARGKLKLAGPIDEFMPSQLAENRIALLPITLDHALRTAALPLHHADPFDRLLIAQSQVERIPILTSDAEFARYNVETVW